MALQMQITFPKYGFSATAAYIQVSNMQLIKSQAGWIASFNVKMYYSASTKAAGNAPVEENYYTMAYTATSPNQDQYNIVKQCYEHLKSLSQFSGAQDV